MRRPLCPVNPQLYSHVRLNDTNDALFVFFFAFANEDTRVKHLLIIFLPNKIRSHYKENHIAAKNFLPKTELRANEFSS